MSGIAPVAGAAPANTPAAKKRAEMQQAAQAFESVFLRQMIGSMRQAKLGEDLFSSRATDEFRDMSDAKVAENMSANGGVGIARLLMQQFDRAEKAK